MKYLKLYENISNELDDQDIESIVNFINTTSKTLTFLIKKLSKKYENKYTFFSPELWDRDQESRINDLLNPFDDTDIEYYSSLNNLLDITDFKFDIRITPFRKNFLDEDVLQNLVNDSAFVRNCEGFITDLNKVNGSKIIDIKLDVNNHSSLCKMEIRFDLKEIYGNNEKAMRNINK